MEYLIAAIITLCSSYLVTEINGVQRELKKMREDIIWILVKLDRRESSPKPVNNSPKPSEPPE